MSEADLPLFSYGTLRRAEVQRATFGRLLEGWPDTLVGYRLGLVEIADAGVVATSGLAMHPIARPTGDPADRIAGVVLLLTRAELTAADAYETVDYARVMVRLESGQEAFVYVGA